MIIQNSFIKAENFNPPFFQTVVIFQVCFSRGNFYIVFVYYVRRNHGLANRNQKLKKLKASGQSAPKRALGPLVLGNGWTPLSFRLAMPR